MESELITLGSSLLVPSVQELAKKPLTTLPPRYVRNDQDSPIISSFLPHHQVPVIDMQKLLGGEYDVESELEKLHHACKEWGFFQLLNHGVEISLVEKVKLEVEDFFNLPMDEKKKFWQKAGDMEGFGQAFVMSEDQKLDWADLFNMITLPVHLRKPHLLPMFPLPLRDTLDSYSKAMEILAMKILNVMAKALKMETSGMVDLFKEGTQSMRMNYYPPCPQPELVIGLHPHSDASALTILLQANEIEGLQVKKHGNWVPVSPLPNAFVINIGDALEIVSNGIYRSIEHRATVNSAKERISIATFYGPKLDVEIGPAPSLVSASSPPLFRRVGYRDYVAGFLSRQLAGKSHLDVMRIPNS